MNKNTLYTGIAVTVTLLVVGVFFILGVPFSSSSINNQVSTGQQAQTVAATQAGAGQVAIQDEVAGTGAAAKSGDTVSINYTGRLADGTVFDTSEGKEPITFTLGSGQVIPGFDQGITGMQVGGKRVITIPPSLAYGPNDYGPIPGNSTLTFEVELVSIAPAAAQQQ
jgi:FKBP-type peptidyl-prolyl cis-trans isomerase